MNGKALGKPARVALLGFGTVGQSVARILCSGEMPQIDLTHIFNRDVDRKRVDWVPSSVSWTESADDILASDTSIVIEVVGGLRPAYDWVNGALQAGKSVVTANKQLMAHHGPELLDLARSRGLEVRFEASVAGGIPVLRALQEGLAGDRLVEVRGILNGTCNYILSRMQSEPIAFADVLADAQKAGYAEADPSEDLDGADAAAKLAIIAAVGLRRPVRVTDIATRSIRPIESVDFMYARELGCTIRQVARASAEDNGAVFAAVRPALVPLTSNFGRDEGSQNLVTVRGVFGGETSFSGSGAGGSPTAVAVVSDVLSVASGERSSRRRRRRPRTTRFAATSSRRITSASRSTTSRASSPPSPPPTRNTASTSKACCSCRSSEGPPAVRDDARGVSGVGARPRPGGSRAERLPRPATARAADLHLT